MVLRDSDHCFGAFSGYADLNKKICGHMKKAPSHEDAFISFPYLVKGGLSSLNETGS